jgi:LmbE family N-acetylglucosaminyl deacetylase
MEVLIDAAHPDDEAAGASSLLARGSVTVLHLTDGVPRDRRFWSPRAGGTVAEYARQRRDEALHALALAGVPEERAHALGLVDQELCFELDAAARAIATWIARLAPSVIVSHAYDGGHPDHDAAACAVARACAIAGAPGRPVEMALYHGAGGAMHAGEFAIAGPPEIAHHLGPGERRRKDDLLRAYASQEETLRPFRALADERFRAAPAYDFTRPPHDGPLLYERWGFPVSGAAWRAAIARAS